MKKLVLSMILVLALLVSIGSGNTAAYSAADRADALNELGLFFGTGTSYDLDSGLTRAQGVALLVRILGKEAEVRSTTYSTPFNDVPDWAEGYIGYAYCKKITYGVAEDSFGADLSMTDFMFLTLVLRAMGYSDAGTKAMYVWDSPYNVAKDFGLIDYAVHNSNFLRRDAVEIFWRALNTKLYNSDFTLADRLIEQGVFTEEMFSSACHIAENGRGYNAGTPIVPDNSNKNPQVPDATTPEIVLPPDPVTPPDNSDPDPGFTTPSDELLPPELDVPPEITPPGAEDDPLPSTPPTPEDDPSPSDPPGPGDDVLPPYDTPIL